MPDSKLITIEEIQSLVNGFERDQEFLTLKTRWDDDFNLWRGAPYNPGKGFMSYTTNLPRVLAQKAISMLTTARLVIRVPDATLNQEEREIANNMERFLYGCININDERLAFADEPTVLGQISWHLVQRGSVACVVYIQKDGERTFPEIQVWDLYNTRYRVGRRGTVWAVHTRNVTREEILQQYGIDIGRSTAQLQDYWSEKYHAIALNSGQWILPPEEHGLDYCPVYIIKTGSQPTLGKLERYTTPNAMRGESIYGANRHIYPIISKVMSDYLTIVHRGVKVPLGYWSQGGTRNLDKDIWQVEDAVAIPLDSATDEKIAPLFEPSMPQDAKLLLDYVASEEQLGGISRVAMGQLDFRLSGFAINQLQGALATIINPFAEAVERAYRVICIALLQQYAKGGWKPVAVRGRTSRNQPFGVKEPDLIKPDEIRPEWQVEVKLMPVYPKDDIQRYQLARFATEGERPITSMRTAMEEIIGVEDVDYENGRKALEWTDGMPMVRLTRAYLAAIDDGDEATAQALLAELRRVTAATKPAPSRGAQGAQALGQMSMENPGMGLPVGKTGMSPQVMPPEVNGGLSPGVLGAEGA